MRSEKGIHILIVDDRPENLLTLEAILEGQGYQLVRAASGEEALKQVLRYDFAAILLDVQMPGLNGFETAELIKKRERSRHVPIIFLTAISKDEQFVFEGYSVGAVDYLFKPFNPDVLKSKVAVFVDLFLKNQQIQRQGELLRLAEQRERERQIAELEQASERRYRNLAEAIPQIVWTARPDGHPSYFNRRWFEYTGLSEAKSLDGGWLDIVHPDDRERDAAAWTEAMRTGAVLTLESRLRRGTDGSYRWHLLRAEPELDEQGQVIAWLGTCTDIDDRIRAQQELERLMGELREHNRAIEAEVAQRTTELLEQQRFNELILRSAGEGIVGLDLEGRIMLVNPAAARMLGYAPEELMGGKLHDVLHHSDSEGEHIPEDDCPIVKAIREGVVGHGSNEVFWRKDGSPLPVEYASNPIHERHTLLGAVVTFKDITERKRAEAEIASRTEALEVVNQRLTEADRYKDEFLSVISHELRTPLNFIMGFTSILDDEVAGALTEEQHDYLRKILNGTDRMLALVDDLLDFAKMQAGKLDLSPRHVEYPALVEEVLTMLRPAAAAKEIKLSADVEVPDSTVLDDQRIVQVLANLAANAIKFTPAGGNVAIHAWVEGDRVITEVVDTGIGIKPDDIPLLFVRFKQLDMSVTRQAGGAGLGLSICKALVEAHGGTIQAKSAGVGKGTTIRFELPVRAQTPPRVVPESKVAS